MKYIQAHPPYDAGLLASCLFNSGKTGQSVRDHVAIGAEMALSPAGDFFGTEAIDYIHIHGNGVAFSLADTAATKGVLLDEPRPRLPQRCWPPQYTSSN